jgi:chromosome segregation ATPase
MDTQNQEALSPLEIELLSSVSRLEERLTRLENSLNADAVTAQAQRQSITDKLQALNKRLASVEQSLPSLTSLSGSLTAFEGQCSDLRTLCETHAQNYNRAITAFKEMQRVWQEQQAANKALQSQVAQLTAALRSLGA